MMSTTNCLILILLWCLIIHGSKASSSHDQIRQKTPTKLLQGSKDGQCPTIEEREEARNQLHHIANRITGYPYRHTCDGTTGWKRVAFINMTDTSHSCPPGLRLTSFSKRTCGRTHTTYGGCSSTTFEVGGAPYTRVCGRIRGYQRSNRGFAFYIFNQATIEGHYLSGVSLTHGQNGQRQHIWTFAAGAAETNGYPDNNACYCDARSYYRIPPFIGNDYFCESGSPSPDNRTIDVLWDGQNCAADGICCQFNSPPWFTKTLNASTTDDIELRLCTFSNPIYEDVPLELIELYIK